MKTFFTADERVVPAHHPRGLVDTAVAQGADRDAVLDGVGTPYEAFLDPDTRISYAQYFCIAENAIRLTNNAGIGLDFGKEASLAHWGVLGLAAMNGINVGDALRMGLQYYRTFAPGWDLSVRVDGGTGYFVAQETISRGPLLVFGTEAMLMTMRSLTTQVLRRPLPLRGLRVNYPRPAHADRYAEFFDGPVFFDEPFTEVSFDARVLDERIEGADPTMAVVAERYCAVEATRATRAEGLLAEVRRVLERLDGSRPTIESTARELRTSTRSLRRGLQQMGTSYQKLLHEVARSHAERSLRQSGAKVEEIALELGFADVRSFRRAFKRWTGTSPSAFRNRR